MTKIFNIEERLALSDPHHENCECEVCKYRLLLKELLVAGKDPKRNQAEIKNIKSQLSKLNPDRETKVYHSLIDVAVFLLHSHNCDIRSFTNDILKRQKMLFSVHKVYGPEGLKGELRIKVFLL